MRLAFLLLLLFSGLQNSLWFEYKSTEPDFVIFFPEKPEIKEKIIDTDIGSTIVSSIFNSSSIDSTENSLYLLNYYQLDQIIFFGDSAIDRSVYLDEAVTSIALSLNADILYSNNEIYSGCPTVTYRLEMKDNNSVMKGKFVLSGDYFYSLQVFSTKQYSLNKNMDKFLSSFKFKTCNSE